ncbi:MAG TPA: hypothetical protein VMV29_22075, partial [Ktedonobacterales bacterium]|nr:hypothetical protein [Ktedonobacterales bacterium]
AHATSVAGVAGNADNADNTKGVHANEGSAPDGPYTGAGAGGSRHADKSGDRTNGDAAPGEALRQRARRIAEGLAPYTPTTHGLPAMPNDAMRDAAMRDAATRNGDSAPLALNDANRDDATLASTTTDQSAQPKNESLAVEVARQAPPDTTELRVGEIADLASLAVALASLNIAATTPLDALNLLFALQQRALAMLQNGNAGQASSS